MWGLAWQIWAIIVFSIFLVSVAGVVVRLILMVNHYHSVDAKLVHRERELKVERLEHEKYMRDIHV